jgi:hypothetical protein
MQVPGNTNMKFVTGPLLPHPMSQAFIVFPQMVFAISVSPTQDETRLVVLCGIQRENCTYHTSRAEQKITQEVV